MSRARSRIRAVCLVLVLLATGLAEAGRGDAVRKQTEAAMWVYGTVQVRPDGTVEDAWVDDADRIPAPVLGLLARSAPTWRFQEVQVDGKPVGTRAKMQVRVIAVPKGEGYEVTLRNAVFGVFGLSERGDVREPEEWIRPLERVDIQYPRNAAAGNVQGDVYVAVRVWNDGRPHDVAVEQVNLKTLGAEHELRRMRDMLAKAAVAGVRRWTFAKPTRGGAVDNESWSGRVVVAFALSDDGAAREAPDRFAPGVWESYLPGPKTIAPWLEDAETAGAGGADSLSNYGDAVRPAGVGLILLTPLEGG